MDADRFDALLAALTTAPSRREALRALVGLGLAGLVGQADAKSKKNNKKKKCAKAGQAPSKKRKRCCAGLVLDSSGVCAAPLPGCTPATCAPTACGSVPDGCEGTLECRCTGNTVCICGTCQPCDVCLGGCIFSALQTAIDAANAGETIRICTGAYSEDLTLIKSLNLIGAGQGNGAGNTILQGSGTTSVVTIAAETIVRLQNLRVTGGGGTGDGGGIDNAGPLTLTDCTITSNTSGTGGGIASVGTQTLIGCTVTGNTTNAQGGGIFNHVGIVTLTTTANVSGNTPDNCGGTLVPLCVDP